MILFSLCYRKKMRQLDFIFQFFRKIVFGIIRKIMIGRFARHFSVTQGETESGIALHYMFSFSLYVIFSWNISFPILVFIQTTHLAMQEFMLLAECRINTTPNKFQCFMLQHFFTQSDANIPNLAMLCSIILSLHMHMCVHEKQAPCLSH